MAACAVITVLVSGAVVVSPQSTRLAGASSTTGAFFDSEAGDYVGASQDLSFTSVVKQGQSVGDTTFSVTAPSHGFFVEFASPPGQPLTVGTYENTERAPFRSAGHPGLDIFGDGRGCNTESGRFIVDEATYDSNSVLLSFSARFESHCEGASAALFGAVSYNSNAPYRSNTVSSNSLTFSGPSTTQNVTITNGGPSSLTMGSASVQGIDAPSFQISNGSTCLNSTVVSGGSCSYDVSFAPTGGGNQAATLVFFDDNAPSGGAGRHVALAASQTSAAGEFTSLTPTRILDTRHGTGGRATPLGPGASFDVQIAGSGGVPLTDVSAVVLNATVTAPTAFSWLTVWPAGVAQPGISNLNFVGGQTVANLVTVAVGANGKVSVFNAAGSTDVIFDVVGFYSDSNGPYGSRFHGITPARFFDTRDGTGGVAKSRVGPGGVLQFHVTGLGGVPATGVTAVVMNVTVTSGDSPSFLTVYPDDVARPLASNLNFAAGGTVPNLVTMRVPSNGLVDFYNAAGSTHLLADVVGYYDGDKSTEAGRLVTDTPARVFDSRVSSPFPPPGQLTSGDILGLQVSNPSIGAFVFNITVTNPDAPGWITAFPDPPPAPLASNVNFVPFQTVPNLAIVRVGNGAVDFSDAGANTDLVIDAFAYFTNDTASGFSSQAVPGALTPRVRHHA